MYDQLLYSAGGGIISNEQKDDQAECVTLLIGLGGTGTDCLRSLKRMVYERLRPDDPKAPIHSYSHIRFLAVDSDDQCCKSDGRIHNLDEKTEFLDISSEDFYGPFKATRRLSGMREFTWLKTPRPEKGEMGIRPITTRGSGGIRQIGRLLLIEKSDRFVNKVMQLLMEAKEGLPHGVEVNVHIFSGLSGGTGSGIFLDACYLVQMALDNIGEGSHANICGYFFLPDVNISLPRIGIDPQICSFMQANGYAALKELDYCMSFGSNGGSWEQQYRGFWIGPVSTPPVKLCHLISAKALNGIVSENSYDIAMNAVGNYVYHFLVRNDTNMTAHIENHNRAVFNISKDHGANYKYIALGASQAVVPIREILTYLGSKLFNGFPDFSKELPANEEIEQFAKDNELDFKGLFKSMMVGATFLVPSIELQEIMFRNMGEPDLGTPNTLILPETIMMPYRNMQNRMAATVGANINALLHEWKRDKIRENQDTTSKVWRIFYALEQVVMDPRRGPLYASSILYGGRKNLVDILKGNLEMVQKQLLNVSADMELRIKEVKAARSAYLHPGFIHNRKRLFETFVVTVANYFTDDNKLIVLRKMEAMIREMIEQFKGLYSEHFELYRKVYDELWWTLHVNYREMSDGEGFGIPDDSFSRYIMKLDDSMRLQLDRAVENLNPAQEAKRFNVMFYNAYDVWAEGDESKIVKFISDYVIKAFGVYTLKTITQYLEMKFDTTHWPAFQDRTYGEILRPLNNMADPLLWESPFYNPMQGNFSYVSVPESAEVIYNAAGRLVRENPEMSLVSGAFKNRILLMRCLCGVPMYGFNGVGLCREAYLRDLGKSYLAGRHIYEGTERDPRDWRELPDLMPFSLFEHLTKEMLENKQTYNRAVDRSIIHAKNAVAGGADDYEIVLYEQPADIEEIKEQTNEVIKRFDASAANIVLRRIEEYLQYREPVRIIRISNDGEYGRKEIVRSDYVMGNPAYLKVIREQLEILDALDRIKSKMEHVIEEEVLGEEYRNALLTGVIEFQFPIKVTYTVVKYGIYKTIELSAPSMQPYGTFIPLYQGFVSYKELDEVSRMRIKDETEKRLKDPLTYEEEIRTAYDYLKERLTERYLVYMQHNAIRFPDKGPEIEWFFMKLGERLIDS